MKKDNVRVLNSKQVVRRSSLAYLGGMFMLYVLDKVATAAVVVLALLLLGLHGGCAHTPPITRVLLPPASSTMFQRVAASTVTILANKGGDNSSLGSGTIVWSDGAYRALTLTCYHVVANLETGDLAKKLTVISQTGESEAEIVSVDRSKDLALVATFSPLHAPALPVAMTEPEAYAKLYVVGSPAGNAGTGSDGVLSSKEHGITNDVGKDIMVWQITSFIYPGSSGGTIANEQGELVCTAESVEANVVPIPQLGYCIPLTSIRSFLQAAGVL